MAIRIVVVEPHPADSRWIALMLDEIGLEYSLMHFGSGLAAIDRLRTEPPESVHALVVNVVLPLLTSADVMRTLQTLPCMAGAKCAVTVVSSLDADRVPPDCTALEKPVDADALLRFLLGN